MISVLPTDILFMIATSLDNVQDVISFSRSNREIYSFFDDTQYMDWGRNIYTREFWSKAEKRNKSISKPLKNMKMELLRIHNFTKMQIRHGQPLWTREDYYLYWKNLE